ncbi:malonyl-CoA decarboxylase-domain-containing protein [Chlamydoabsidia padenii]|nr:malonyl-CoA decarboxylase-domain-containing protein [Chlamydoabsidia padenii]
MQDKPNDFMFSVDSSKVAIQDDTFMQRLFVQTANEHHTSSNTQDTLVSHCYDLFQLLDPSDQLVYLQHFSNSNTCQHSTSSFFHSLCQLPGGVKRMIDFRASLLALLRHYPCKQSILAPIESTLKSSIKIKMLPSDGSSQLSINRITWQSSPFKVIEKLCRYEAVHPVKDLKDIQRRLAPDRRVYALFSQDLPMEPLVFVHVALEPELSNSIQTILAPYNNRSLSSNYRYAICYSITTQQGLGGMYLGNYLIRHIIDQLQQTYPRIHIFATLSPIPGFRQWLDNQLLQDHTLWEQLVQAGGGTQWKHDIRDTPKDSPLAKILLQLCARYILDEKRPNKGALDPVANFHFRNGACAHQLHWLGDVSEKGVDESFGIMINYNYVPCKLNEHHQQYIDNGIIFVSEQQDSCPSTWLSEWLGDGVVKLD